MALMCHQGSSVWHVSTSNYLSLTANSRDADVRGDCARGERGDVQWGDWQIARGILCQVVGVSRKGGTHVGGGVVAECSLFFFFSSRRRHTRCSRDWSSDVCSSDLFIPSFGTGLLRQGGLLSVQLRAKPRGEEKIYELDERDGEPEPGRHHPYVQEIGRASCRERV